MFELAGIAVRAVSTGGVETCIELPGLGVCFDMGSCPPTAVRLPLVLFTHAHVDHMAGVVAHCATRELQGMKPPTYVMPERNVEAFHELLAVWRRLDGSPLPCRVVGLPPGQPFPVRESLVARAFATPHRVVSQGYVLTEHRKRLRAELQGQPSDEIRRRRALGESVTEAVEVPLVAFTGDSRAEILDREPALYQARLLIMEVTFLDDRVSVEKTREKGHIHLDEVLERADLFENQAILFTHLSARYSARQAQEILDRRLPAGLRERVTLLATVNARPGRLPPTA